MGIRIHDQAVPRACTHRKEAEAEVEVERPVQNCNACVVRINGRLSQPPSRLLVNGHPIVVLMDSVHPFWRQPISRLAPGKAPRLQPGQRRQMVPAKGRTTPSHRPATSPHSMFSCTDSPSFDISASRTSLLTVTRSLSVVSMVLVMVFTSATFGAPGREWRGQLRRVQPAEPADGLNPAQEAAPTPEAAPAPQALHRRAPLVVGNPLRRHQHRQGAPFCHRARFQWDSLHLAPTPWFL